MSDIEARAVVTFPANCQLTPEEAVKSAVGIFQLEHSVDGCDVAFSARFTENDQFPSMPDDGRLRVSVSNGYLPDIDAASDGEDGDASLLNNATETHKDCLKAGEWWYQVSVGNATIANIEALDNGDMNTEIENDRLYAIQEDAKSKSILYAHSDDRPPIEFPVSMLKAPQGDERDTVRRALLEGKSVLGGTQININDTNAAAILTKIAKSFQDDGYIDHMKDVVWSLHSETALTKEDVSNLFIIADDRKPSHSLE